MHAHTRVHVRRRIALAAVALATAIATTPAQGAPRTDSRPTKPVTAAESGKKRHWSRNRWLHIHWTRPTRQRRRTAAEIVLARARAQLGKRYVYGGAGPDSFDCSGFTQFVWAAAGISLPHNAAAQYASTRRVPLKDARPGDLVFSSGLGHVGLYLGRGRMIHAPQTGRSVEIAPLRRNVVGFGRPSR